MKRSCRLHCRLCRESPPMRGRGLKHRGPALLFGRLGSPPMRGRGLKLCWGHVRRRSIWVAPHAGAWIETLLGACSSAVHLGRPPCGGVD